MRRSPKKKGQRRPRKKSRIGRLFLLISLLVIGGAVYLFRQEILDALRSLPEKKIPKPETRSVTLFFADEEGEYLVGEKREIAKSGRIVEEARQTLMELIKGPRKRLIPTLPPKTRLLSLEMGGNGIVKVNFDRTLSKDHPGGSSGELMTVYSIVNSLTLNFPQIQRVQILIDGKEVESIAGHISLKQPLSSNLKMIKK